MRVLCRLYTCDSIIKSTMYVRMRALLPGDAFSSPHDTSRTSHTSSGVVYQRKSFDPAATGLQGLRWDDAEVFEATAIHQMAYDDAFTLMEVCHVFVRMRVCVRTSIPEVQCSNLVASSHIVSLIRCNCC